MTTVQNRCRNNPSQTLIRKLLIIINDSWRRVLGLTLISVMLLIVVYSLMADFFIEQGGEEVVLESSELRVSIGLDGALNVLDKRLNRTWRQIFPKYSHAERARVSKVERVDDLTAKVVIKRPVMAEVTVKICGENLRDVLVEIRPSEPTDEISRLLYPYPFAPPSSRDHLVLPYFSGVLLPVTEMRLSNGRAHGGSNQWSMPWFGEVDERLVGGYMAIADTPYDVDLVILPLASDDGVRVVAPSVYWLPSLGRFAYTRRVIYAFTDRDGYVAMAKRYREHVIENGGFITLRRKVEQNPNVAKLIGGVNARLIHHPKTPSPSSAMSTEHIRLIPMYGVIRGSLCVVPKTDPECKNLTLDLADEFREEYDLIMTLWTTFSHVNPKPKGYFEELDAMMRSGEITKQPLLSEWEMEEPNLLTRRDGSLSPGGGLFSGFYRICPTSYLDRLKDFLDRVKRYCPIRLNESIKLDTFCAFLDECWDEKHPATRMEDKRYRLELLRWLKSNSYVISVEGISDWAVPYVDTAYGILGVPIFGSGDVIPPFHLYKFSKLLHRELFEEYFLGPKHRIPLFDLVYHDSIISMFHDGHSNNMYYENLTLTYKYWGLKDLIQILHGTAPNFHLTVDEYFEEQKDRIRKTVETVSRWHELVAYDEMVTHRFLTKDRMVQETKFSSGWSVIVNFREDESYISEVGVVEPLSYLTYKWKNN